MVDVQAGPTTKGSLLARTITSIGPAVRFESAVQEDLGGKSPTPVTRLGKTVKDLLRIE